jgi:hypothetical protein
MTAATCRASWYGAYATEPIGLTAETGVILIRSDTEAGSSPPVTVPTTTGSSYSWVQQLALEVTVAASPVTTLSNASVKLSAPLAAGLAVFFKSNASFLNQTGGTQGPPDVATENAGAPSTPAGYTLVTTVAQIWDAMGTPNNGGSLGRKSTFLDLVLGIASGYAGPPGSLSLAAALMEYGES